MVMDAPAGGEGDYEPSMPRCRSCQQPIPPGSPHETPTFPATAIVPDVVCRSLNPAQNQITKAGLTSSVVGSQPNPSCPNTNKVAAQAPGGGTEVEQGTTVKLWTSEPGSSGSPSA